MTATPGVYRPLPLWSAVGKWLFVLCTTINLVARMIDDSTDGAAWTFRGAVATVGACGLVVWAAAGVVWLVRNRQSSQ